MSESSRPTRANVTQFAGSYRPLATTAVAGDAPIPVGDIQFYDSYLPLLDAGDYTIAIHQDIESTDSAHPLSEKDDVTQPFSVIAPRFALDPSEIQSVFPPANSNGPYDQNIAHVVLMQRALPWERELGTGLPVPTNPNAATYPWLALLLFADGEILPPPGAPATSAVTNPTCVGTYPVAQLLTPTDTTILGPNVQPQREDETTCRAIDVSTAIFTQVTPRLADLPYLAHARQVNVDQKTTSLAVTSGWFSVVTGNRFPVVGTNPNGTRNIVHLVSLEGFTDYLVDKPTWPAGVQTVRLASLASWVFTAQAEGADFRQLMLNLVAGEPEGGDDLRLRLPVPAPTTTPAVGSPEDFARQALGQGFAALEYETRVGDQTFAWYHGPLVPHPVPAIAAGTAFASSAAATIYDPTSGTFDLSYAASWELGRMLALSDRAYSTNQQRARKSLRTLVNLVRERTRWSSGQVQLDATSAAALEELVQPRQVSRPVASWLGANYAAQLARPGNVPKFLTDLRVVPRAPVVDALVTLHARPDVQALVQTRVVQAMDDGPMNSVVDWLTGLRLLEGVPFVHLVPDARMLPAESIRFFYVDGNTLDALCDGAQSVGVQTTRDATQQQLVRDPVRQATIARARVRRATLLGRPIALDDGTPPADPVAGFVLRSAVVSGWPGLEIKAYTDLAGTQPIDPVRIDHLAPDVLIALYPSVPARIELDEPKEGLAFGVEDDWVVGVRSIMGSNVGTVIGQTTLAATYRRTNGVIMVDAWQQYLSTQLPSGSSAVWGPGAYALQMVRAPEQMIFDNGGTST